MREAATICPAPCKLTFDLLTLKVVSESRVTCATSVPILVFLGLSSSRLRPDVRDRQDRWTSDAHRRIMYRPCPRHNNRSVLPCRLVSTAPGDLPGGLRFVYHGTQPRTSDSEYPAARLTDYSHGSWPHVLGSLAALLRFHCASPCKFIAPELDIIKARFSCTAYNNTNEKAPTGHANTARWL